MHRYSHYIYIYILAHKQTKPPSLLQATRNLPRRLNSACCDFGPGASPSTPLPCPLPCTDCSASAMWPCCFWSLLHVEPLHICDLPAATFQQLSSCCLFSFFRPISLVVRASDQILCFCCRACTQVSPLCSVISIAGHPGNGLHWRDHLLQRPLGRRGSRGSAFGMVH